MGLKEYVNLGMKLERNTVTFTTDSTFSGSIDLGSAYALLNIQTNIPCRLRLYDDSGSMENDGEKTRAFTNTQVSASVALIGDFSMSAGNTYFSIDPVLYAVTSTASRTHYRIDNAATPPVITLNKYLLENSALSTANRITLPYITGSLGTTSPSNTVVGILNNTIPTTYLLVSSSLTNSSHTARLRLYSNSGSLTDSTEINRTFSTEPPVNSNIIADIIIDGNELLNFSPKIIGANLQRMGTNLDVLRSNESNYVGNPELYYILQNLGAVSANISASLHIFSLES